MDPVQALLTSSEFWSAIAGAVVGGAIGLIGQIFTIRAARKERLEDANARNKGLAYSLMFKLVEVHAHFGGLAQSVAEAESRRRGNRETPRAWQVLLPIANLPSHIRFSADEMAMLLSLGDLEAFNAVRPLDETHNSVIDAFQKYATLREEINALLPATMDGMVATSGLTPVQRQQIDPRLADLDSLAEDLCRRTPSFEARSITALDRAQRVLHDRIGLAARVGIPPTE